MLAKFVYPQHFTGQYCTIDNPEDMSSGLSMVVRKPKQLQFKLSSLVLFALYQKNSPLPACARSFSY